MARYDPRFDPKAPETVVLMGGTSWGKTEAFSTDAVQQYLESTRNKPKPPAPRPAGLNISKSLPGRHRNMKCPCGSGLKAKKCCGRP
jgi:hypothetical protein